MQINNITPSNINNFSTSSNNNSPFNGKSLQKCVLTKEQLEQLDKKILIQLLLQLNQEYKQTQQQVQGLQEENQYLKKELSKCQENIEELLTFSSKNIHLDFHSASSNPSLSTRCDSFTIKNRNPPSISKSSSKKSVLQERKEKYYNLPVGIQRHLKRLKTWFLKQREKQQRNNSKELITFSTDECEAYLKVSKPTARKYLLLFLDLFQSVIQLYKNGSKGRGHFLTLSLLDQNFCDLL